MKYKYAESDGNVFRGEVSEDPVYARFGVIYNEIGTSEGWKGYTGDTVKVQIFGSPISEVEAKEYFHIYYERDMPC